MTTTDHQITSARRIHGPQGTVQYHARCACGWQHLGVTVTAAGLAVTAHFRHHDTPIRMAPRGFRLR